MIGIVYAWLFLFISLLKGTGPVGGAVLIASTAYLIYQHPDIILNMMLAWVYVWKTGDELISHR